VASALEPAALAASAARSGTAARDAGAARQGERARAVTLALLPICAALVLRAVALEPFAVASDSMRPALAPGERVFVNKLAYGARVPFSALRLPSLREPARGDVVVLEGFSGRRSRLVKRIVGLPGERVAVRGGVLTVNGLALEGAAARAPAALSDAVELRVPAGHYFVLGDNRKHSADSRVFGAVPRARLVGPLAEWPWAEPRFGREGASGE
jgi:signal peptidase I